MTKKHILKKKETKLWKRIGPVTDENIDDYPMGNPYGSGPSKADLKWARKMRIENRAKRTPEEIEMHRVFVERIMAEGKAEAERNEMIRIRNIFKIK